MLPVQRWRVSNNSDWYRAFSLKLGGSALPPWSGVPAFVPGQVYQSSTPHSACTFAGDLYIAKPNTSNFFDASFDPAKWLKVGSAAAFAQIPYDLEGAQLRFAIQPSDAEGNVDVASENVFEASSRPGDGIIINNASAGGVIIDIPTTRTVGVAAGFYAFDIIASHADGRVERVVVGVLTVDEGLAR